jgi:hypothetical protein
MKPCFTTLNPVETPRDADGTARPATTHTHTGLVSPIRGARGAWLRLQVFVADSRQSNKLKPR